MQPSGCSNRHTQVVLCTTGQTNIRQPDTIVVAVRSKTSMLFVIAAIVALVTLAMRSRLGRFAGTQPAPLGWMSERWLTEYRASHGM
jgi:hypothetical protein